MGDKRSSRPTKSSRTGFSLTGFLIVGFLNEQPLGVGCNELLYLTTNSANFTFLIRPVLSILDSKFF